MEKLLKQDIETFHGHKLEIEMVNHRYFCTNGTTRGQTNFLEVECKGNDADSLKQILSKNQVSRFVVRN